MPEVTELTAKAVALTKTQEGFIDHIYLDVAGVPTIGYGTTVGVINPLPRTCTEAQATEWLLLAMNRDVIPAILATGFKPENENELAALADFGYNLGPGDFALGHTIGNALHASDRPAIANAFLLYDRDINGTVLSDLAHRRELERALFLDKPPHVPSYHYDWYAKGRMRTAAERYDHWRGKAKLNAAEKVFLAARRHQCAHYAKQVAANAKKHPKDGKPSWSVNHHGFRFQELDARGKGKLVKPA